MVDNKTAATLTALNGFLAKTDGRDKLCATLQYVAMFIAAGEPGKARSIAASVAAARKVFRVLRPVEALTPILLQPRLLPNKPIHTQVLDKAKTLLNVVYFGCDHVVWASQAGIYSNKEVVARCQKASLWGWFGASCCTIVNETIELIRSAPKAAGKAATDEDAVRRRQALEVMQKRLLVLFHNLLMAMTAIGLLQLRPWKPRFVGFLGSLASIINCYMLFPALAAAPAKPAAALLRASEPADLAPKLPQKVA